jgi:hypothetical protein
MMDADREKRKYRGSRLFKSSVVHHTSQIVLSGIERRPGVA